MNKERRIHKLNKELEWRKRQCVRIAAVARKHMRQAEYLVNLLDNISEEIDKIHEEIERLSESNN